MLETIKLVAGTVADKDLIMAFTHIHITDGRIQGMDGRCVAIDSECAQLKGIQATVPADRFLRAVVACDGEPTITLSEKKLIIKRAGFKAMLPLMEHQDYPAVEGPPEDGERHLVKAGFVGALRRMKPFISQDASRPWSNGVLLKSGAMYATNNVILVSLPFPAPIEVSLPTAAVDELIRVNQDPKEVLQTEHAIYFIYDRFWMRVLHSVLPWPDVAGMLEKFDFDALEVVPGQLLDAVRKIAHFHPDPKFPVVIFDSTGIHTMDGQHRASVEGMELPDGKYRAEIIQLVLNEAIKADFTKYPAPCPFSGMDKLRGMVVGVRQ
jgi:hypothetical protein